MATWKTGNVPLPTGNGLGGSGFSSVLMNWFTTSALKCVRLGGGGRSCLVRLIPHNPPQKELEGLALLQVTARQPKNLSVGCGFEGRDSTCDIWLEGSHLSMVLWGPRMEKGSDIPWDVFPEGGIKALAVMKRQGGTKPCLASMPDHQSTREDAEERRGLVGGILPW